MTDASTTPDNRSPNTTSHDRHQITTTPEQALRGLEIGQATREMPCTVCGRALREREDCVVYAYRTVDAPAWVVARCYCRACAPGTIEQPTLGATEVLITATFGLCSRACVQSHQLCLLNIDLQTLCWPQTGGQP